MFAELQKVSVSFLFSVCASIWNSLAFTRCNFVKFCTGDLHENLLRKFRFHKIGQDLHVFMTSFVITITIVANIAVGFWLSWLLRLQMFCGFMNALWRWVFSISLHHTNMFLLSQVHFSPFYSVLDRVPGTESESALRDAGIHRSQLRIWLVHSSNALGLEEQSTKREREWRMASRGVGWSNASVQLTVVIILNISYIFLSWSASCLLLSAFHSVLCDIFQLIEVISVECNDKVSKNLHHTHHLPNQQPFISTPTCFNPIFIVIIQECCFGNMFWHLVCRVLLLCDLFNWRYMVEHGTLL